MAQEGDYDFKALLTVGLGNMYNAVAGLCVSGVSAYLYLLKKREHDEENGIETESKIDGAVTNASD